ncbi:MAG: type II secretion system major pseudopilin GspG [Phycisphaerales bacterium]|nr:type II secretion system major pseudopilin GspG [Phycisphaerales bacterium]
MHHHRSSRRPARRAFTLLEIIVVVTIIALLAALVAPRLLQNVDKTKVSSAKAGCSAIAKQLSIYLMDIGRSTPEDDMDLSILLQGPDDGGGSGGPYLSKAADLIDPWKNEYYLRVPGEVNYDFDVVSNGADGQPGGDGYNADITN